MNRRRLHGWLLFGACILLASISVLFAWRERQTFLGIPVMSERAYGLLPEYAYEDLVDYLTQNGHSAAIDRSESVLYVSLDPRIHDEMAHMPVTLALHHPRYRLFFAPDAAFDDFEQAVLDGHRFTLLAVAPAEHMRYDVVFTTLPVIRLSTEKGSDGYEQEGGLCLWSDYPSEEGYYCVSASKARWHKRGGTTRSADKASYKITLEKPSGKNNGMTLLNMGSDDDWILNAMSKDDLKLREMTITRLWNEHQEMTRYQIPMSPCHYAEVVLDGRYMGLYLLQRRMDNKLLGEQYRNDVIYKGVENYQPDIPAEAVIAIQHNPRQIASEELYEYIHPFYNMLLTKDSQYDVLTIDEENWLDLNAFCSIFALGDNRGSKNIFLIRHERNGEYVLHFDLWDTDMSMGLKWKVADNDILYEPNNAKKGVYLRNEANVRFDADKQLYSAYLEQYTHLRSGVLSEENIRQTILDCYREITESGALQRDLEKWGLRNHGEDSLENLLAFVHDRTNWLDKTYLKTE